MEEKKSGCWKMKKTGKNLAYFTYPNYQVHSSSFLYLLSFLSLFHPLKKGWKAWNVEFIISPTIISSQCFFPIKVLFFFDKYKT